LLALLLPALAFLPPLKTTRFALGFASIPLGHSHLPTWKGAYSQPQIYELVKLHTHEKTVGHYAD
jgi:hypothetical protein